MTTDIRQLDFLSLSERISAQTSAYMEFSNALVKLIENSASIRDRLNENNLILREEYALLLNKTQEILIIISNYTLSTASDHKLLIRDLDNFQTNLSYFEKKLSLISEDNEEGRNILNKIYTDIFKYFQSVSDRFIIADELNKNNFHEINNKLDKANSKLVSIGDEVARHKNFRIKTANIIAGLTAIIGIILLLSSLNIIKISWFGN